MKLRSPVKWHGGKSYLASQIIALLPPHRIYVEPFAGGASVLLNKPPVEVEVYNDIDVRVSRLFRVLRDDGYEFRRRVEITPYSEFEFFTATEYPPDASMVDMAVCDFVRWRQSFGGKGQAFSLTTRRARGGMAGDVNAWWTAIEGLPQVVDRLRRVQIMCQSAFDLIPRFDDPDALIYCDPPYVHSTRSDTAVYHAEMTDDDHRRLAGLLNASEAKAVVSGYPSTLYDELYAGWRQIELDVAMHAAGGKKKSRAAERLWLNY